MLSEAEIAALTALEASGSGRGRPISVDDLPDRTSEDLWGFPVPGKKVWMRLIKRGLVIVPEEEPIDLGDGCLFTFTAFLELTEHGRIALNTARHA